MMENDSDLLDERADGDPKLGRFNMDEVEDALSGGIFQIKIQKIQLASRVDIKKEYNILKCFVQFILRQNKKNA